MATNNPKNILFVCLTTRYSGGEIVFERLVKDLANCTTYSPLVAASNDILLNNLAKSGIETLKINNVSALNRSNGSPSIFHIFKNFISTKKQIHKILDSRNISLIHANSLDSAVYMAWPNYKHKLPVIFHNHNVLKENPFIMWFLTKLGGTTIFPVSVSKVAAKSLPNPLMAKGIIIHNGIDTQVRFNPARVQGGLLTGSRDKDAAPIHIGFVGQIHHSKGIDIVIKSLSRLKTCLPQKKFKFFIAGHIDLNSEYYLFLRDLVCRQDMISHVDFLGPIKEIERFYKDIDVLVVPSRSPEAFPTVILEGASMEKVVISSFSGGSQEILEDKKEGFFFKTDSVDDLTSIFQVVLNQFDKLGELKSKARNKIISQFDIKSQTSSFIKLYNNLLNNNIYQKQI